MNEIDTYFNVRIFFEEKKVRCNNFGQTIIDNIILLLLLLLFTFVLRAVYFVKTTLSEGLDTYR